MEVELRAPASHLTGFLHTLGSVFQLAHQILKEEALLKFSGNKNAKATYPEEKT